MNKPVLVLGGGIAGIQASIDLAEMGIPVYLVEGSPALGGRMAQLDKTFPTNDCSTCILAPKVSECFTHENVTTYTYCDLVDVGGQKGDFTARIRKKPRYINEDLCTGCGECIDKCPVKVSDGFNEGLNKRKAIYKLYDQGVPNIVTIDDEHCLKLTKGRCGVCAKVCNTGAINYDQKEEFIDLNVGAVILAAGYDAFMGNIVSEYGYRRYSNVVTSLEYERMLSASGPTSGHISRPSDEKEAERIAFIHCTGSRDIRTDKAYCSAVCCMYSIKEAIITKEHGAGKDTIDLYYMDMRAYGKGFERYFNAAEATAGVNFIRSRVAEMEENPENGDIIVKAVDTGGNYSEKEYDLVVLSVGLQPSPQMTELLKKLKVRTNRHGFAAVDELNPLATGREGIFACGVVTGPQDIPESVIQASGAAAAAAEIARGDAEEERQEVEKITPKEAALEKYTENERAKVGVFVCRCGSNIGGIVDVPWVTEKAAHLPFVEHAEEVMYLCAADGLDLIAQRIKEKDLNRVVVASCTPRTHEELFRRATEKAGLNPYLMIMTNIRDQNSWVHMEQKDKATLKALDLVRGAVAKAVFASSLYRSRVDKLNEATVIGGGLAGMTAALQLAGMGFNVSLVEQENKLGGRANDKLMTMGGRPVAPFLDTLKKQVEDNPLIKVFTGYNVEAIDGYIGKYKLTLSKDGDKHEVETGVIIVATGAGELTTTEYLAGTSEHVIGQLDLEKRLQEGRIAQQTKKIFMVQCVGSREDSREYCSRLCCTQAVNNAIFIKERWPEVDITIFFREMRTYGYFEERFRLARKLGVKFVRYTVDEKPKVEATPNGVRIIYHEPITGDIFTEDGNLLVLARAIVANENNKELSKQLKVPLNEDGFFLEAHVKLRPVDFATDGIFVCGLAHGPKNMGESIAQAKAAASRAAMVLAQEFLLTEPMVAAVRADLCSGCGTCEQVCPYKAVKLDEEKKKAEVNEVLCKGCGSCCAVCRSHALDLKGFSHLGLVEELHAIFADRELQKPKVRGIAVGK